MAIRLLEVIAPLRRADAIEKILQESDAFDIWRVAETEGDGSRVVMHALVETGRQDLIDRLQDELAGRENWRIILTPVDAAIPKPELKPEAKQDRDSKNLSATREELYDHVAKGAKIDRTYLMMVCFSAIVAISALVLDNVAVLIGAMVIAPFLGPNLAFALGAALGDRPLMISAVKAFIFGVTLALIMGIITGYLSWPYLGLRLNAEELLARTTLGFDGVIIALASGACAALSLTSRTMSSLVGVMVAVALLPPLVTSGIMLGASRFAEAGGAMALFLVNIASVNIAALSIFLLEGVRPRRWLEKRQAQQSRLLAYSVWGILLCVLIILIIYRKGFFIISIVLIS